MKIRAAIFDIYRTLLVVGPRPDDAEQRWAKLRAKMLPGDPVAITLLELVRRCQLIADREQTTVGNLGIPFPEIYWPAVITEIFPARTFSSASSPTASAARCANSTTPSPPRNHPGRNPHRRRRRLQRHRPRAPRPGFQTWQLLSDPAGENSGRWRRLGDHLRNFQ